MELWLILAIGMGIAWTLFVYFYAFQLGYNAGYADWSQVIEPERAAGKEAREREQTQAVEYANKLYDVAKTFESEHRDLIEEQGRYAALDKVAGNLSRYLIKTGIRGQVPYSRCLACSLEWTGQQEVHRTNCPVAAYHAMQEGR